MLVFIDESGDPGFKLGQGSSPVFVVAMVIFDCAADAIAADSAIREAKQKLRVKAEFKFNSSADVVKEGFFNAVANCRFHVRAIVVDKSKIRSHNLKDNKDRFYGYFVRQMMTWDGGLLVNAKVRIDGSGDREFKQELAAYLRRHAGPGKIQSVDFSDSRRDPLIQLSDMVVGAIGRSYRVDKQNPWRWRRMISRQLRDVWDFG